MPSEATILLLAVTTAGVNAAYLAQFVPQDLNTRTVNTDGGWSLAQTSAGTCPVNTPQCGSQWCCPGTLDCIHTGTEDIAEVCCPSQTDCSATFQATPICADSSWSLWNATKATANAAEYFCCLQGQVGLQSGYCVDSANAATAGAPALPLNSAAPTSVAVSSSASAATGLSSALISGPTTSPNTSPATNPPNSPNPTSLTSIPTSTPSQTPVGAIVGGVVGGLAVIALAAIAIILLLRRRNQQPAPAQPAIVGPEVVQQQHLQQQPPPGTPYDPKHVSHTSTYPTTPNSLPPAYQNMAGQSQASHTPSGVPPTPELANAADSYPYYPASLSVGAVTPATPYQLQYGNTQSSTLASPIEMSAHTVPMPGAVEMNADQTQR